MNRRLLMVVSASFVLSVALSAAARWIPLPSVLLLAARWLAIAVFAAYGVYRRSLTTWILIAMVSGAALGHDWPNVAVNLRVLALIFLRLIQTIVAPLLFATLVS